MINNNNSDRKSRRNLLKLAQEKESAGEKKPLESYLESQKKCRWKNGMLKYSGK